MSKLTHIAIDDHDKRSFKDKEIDRWELQYSGCIIIRSSYKSEEELDAAWEKFQQMPYDLQLVADDESLRLFGITNQKMYRRLKKVYLKRDIDNSDLIPLVYTPKDAIIESQGIDKNKRAYQYMRDTGYPMITDVDNLDELDKQWYKFCNIDKDIRTKSDGVSYEIYGMNNEEHYQNELNKLLRQDIDDTGYDDIIGESTNISYLISALDEVTESNDRIRSARRVFRILEETRQYSQVEFDIANYIITRFNASLREESVLCPLRTNWNPYYTPDELDVLGQYNPAFTLKDKQGDLKPYNNDIVPNRLIPSDTWYNNYKAKYYGLSNRRPMLQAWKESVHRLMRMIDNSENEEDIELLRECVIGFGWNPYVEFTKENMDKASNRIKQYVNENIGYRFIDISESFIPSMNIDSPVERTNGLFVLFPYEYTTTDQQLINDEPKVYVSVGDLDTFISIRNGTVSTSKSFFEITRIFNRCAIYYVPMDSITASKIDEALKYISDNPVRFGYNFLYDLCIQLNSQCPEITDQKLFCTYLVNMIIQISKADLTSPGSVRILPLLSVYDKKHSIYKVFDDRIHKFNPKEIIQNKINIFNGFIAGSVLNSTLVKQESLEYIKPLLQMDYISLDEDVKQYTHESNRITAKQLEDMFSFE